MSLRSLLLAAAAFSAMSPAAYATDYAGGAIKSMEASGSEILTDANGMTLYTFDKDTIGESNCYEGCAVKWPPLIAADGAKADGDYTLVTRKDGAMQWAYDGKPLYLWKNDVAPGDTSGDGVGGVWHLVKE